MNFRGVYDKLLRTYGPQGWWPVTEDSGPEYFPGDYSHPKNSRETWEIMVGAILTQNTSWKNVERALENLISEDCLDIKCMSTIANDRLADLVRPAGYYNQKASRLKDLANYFLDVWNGNFDLFFDRPVDEVRAELIDLKGIGRETADSIILYAGKKPIFIVDVYTRRIFQRLGLISGDEDYDRIRKLVESEFSSFSLEGRRKIFNEFHALLVRHAKEHCRKKPVCDGCPLRAECSQKA